MSLPPPVYPAPFGPPPRRSLWPLVLLLGLGCVLPLLSLAVGAILMALTLTRVPVKSSSREVVVSQQKSVTLTSHDLVAGLFVEAEGKQVVALAEKDSRVRTAFGTPLVLTGPARLEKRTEKWEDFGDHQKRIEGSKKHGDAAGTFFRFTDALRSFAG